MTKIDLDTATQLLKQFAEDAEQGKCDIGAVLVSMNRRAEIRAKRQESLDKFGSSDGRLLSEI